MKALVYLGPGRMELQDAPDPTPEPGEVVIESRASAICGSDLHGFREASPRRIPPLIMGHETVGEIAEVGDGVSRSRVIGERVVLKPIVSCGVCRWCREGAINHCPAGRLVGRDLTGAASPSGSRCRPAPRVPFDADVSDEVADARRSRWRTPCTWRRGP